ncbi:MAG: undecaprenyl-diphosphate phosphatase [bacterium]|nr:undecaprenyl-diphosphate phosphatase [bacterium]
MGDSVYFLEAILLGLIEGLTEFLPISSSAHLLILPTLFKLPYFGKAFDIALHGGALAAVIFYKWELLVQIGTAFRNYARACWVKGAMVAWKDFGDPHLSLGVVALVGAVPVALAGFCLEYAVQAYFHSMLFVALMLVVFAWIMERADREGGQNKEMADLGVRDALKIGLAQILAIFPGVSRSGIVLSAARFLNIGRSDAALVSLTTALPVVGGAFLVKLFKGFDQLSALASWDSYYLLLLVCGVTTAFWSGLAGIVILEQVMSKSNLRPFAIYRTALAVVLVVFWLIKP